MGPESVEGAKMGVLLIVFGAILALGLIIFMLGRGIANEGLTGVTDKLDSAMKSEFADFDQQVISGTRLESAISSFKGKKVTLLIATQSMKDHTVRDTANFDIGKAVTSADVLKANVSTSASKPANAIGGPYNLLDSTSSMGTHKSLAYAIAVSKPQPGELLVGPKTDTSGDFAKSRLIMQTMRANNTAAPAIFIQYNALLASTDFTSGATTGNSGNTVIYWDQDHYVVQGGFRMDDNSRVVYDNDVSSTSKEGLTEMIPGAGRFQANLLTDESGTYMGIVCEQVGR